MEQQNTELDIEQRIEQLKKITRQDGDEEYALAQFKLGQIYYEYKKNWQQAIDRLSKIEKKDNPQIYTKAQLILGSIYQAKYNNFEQAERYYLNVEKQDNPEVYAAAQLNLGIIYQYKKLDIKQAELCYLNIEKQDNPKVYAQAQLNLGVIYQFKKQDIKQAELCYLNIEKQDNPELYAVAQFGLGNIYKKYNIKKAEHYYLNIEKQDNPELYAAAQLILGNIYREEKNDIKKSELYYLKVEKEDSPKAYALAQCKLGDNVFFNKMQNKLKLPEEYYQNVAYSDSSFKSYIIAQMMLSVISNKDSSIFKEKQRDELVAKICDIRELTINIQKELLVTFNLNESENNDGQVFERQVAHYTKPEVLFNLLKNKPSDFRLNVVDFMNDPTENQVLTDWLGINTENNNEIKTFLASFSFNHNSLNQFRLYGNENNIVGSSVSVVFNQEFFSKNIKRTINSEGINSLFKYENLSSQQNDLNENSNPKNPEIVAEKKNYIFCWFFAIIPLSLLRSKK